MKIQFLYKDQQQINVFLVLAYAGRKTSGNNTLIFRNRQTEPADFQYTIMIANSQVCQFR